MSGSGKSYLAQFHAKHMLSAGRDLIVFDPRWTETPKTPGDVRVCKSLKERWMDPAFISGDREEFAEVANNSENCSIFIDESVEFFDRGNFIPGLAIITRGRENGNFVGCIGQHYNSFPPSVRNNMSSFYCFRVSDEIARHIAQDAGDRAFREAPKLRNRQCIAKIQDRDAFLLNTERLNK
jgi:hypothetical protein